METMETAVPVMELGLEIEYRDWKKLVNALESGADKAYFVIGQPPVQEDDEDLSFLG